ncbi:MAG TPA: sterol desaturase family protein [Thermoanaerobaculia bacterium]|nr:sterol desaturase family protein [Thermoanaerobaculia bacterium]
MTQGSLRVAFFLGGLFTLLSWELVKPHHPPAAPRWRRWLANLGLALINGSVVSALCIMCITLAERRAAPWRYGLFERLSVPRGIRLGLEILVLDLLVYLLHRLYHRAPFFWRFHQVHHTDLDLDVTSASRFHLGEVFSSAAAKLAAVQSLGISPTGLVAFEISLLLAAQFQHANILLPRLLERSLWWTFVPPAMHRVHHHPTPEMNSNFGTLVTAWDRLLGTLRRSPVEPSAFGLPELRNEEKLGLWTLLQMPFRRGDR